MPRRPEAKKKARDKRERKTERENPAVQGQILETRNARRRKRDQQITAPCRQTKSKPTTDQGENNTLDKELANNLPARRSHSGADGEFTSSGGTTRGEQIGEVRTSDEEDESHRPEQQGQATTIIAHLIFKQRSHRH